MHTVSELAGGDYLKMDLILSEPVMDIFAYLQYMDAKVRAENVQQKYVLEMNSHKHK